MHLSILVVLAAAATESLFGFVGTKNIAVGLSESMVFDWRAGRDVPLGFEVVVEELRMTYFPALAKIGVSETSTGRRLDLLTVREGAATSTAAGDSRASGRPVRCRLVDAGNRRASGGDKGEAPLLDRSEGAVGFHRGPLSADARRLAARSAGGARPGRDPRARPGSYAETNCG